ncbi:MAG: hypothetical protein CM1200mP1_08710 [Candidatus Neomarinimicrobiota bacterium]|nr:MAG: hypothetical protein CM1200mP1_08710 [Candidatus Neomarinimicrobiota bacterium]
MVSCPKISVDPESFLTRPVNIFIVVVLPAPFGPKAQKTPRHQYLYLYL